MNPERTIAYRKQASALLESVLCEAITPRAALNTWPMSGNVDPSVQCAYTMLWFFEADEDRHQQEVFYADLQLKALQEAYCYLCQGEALPVSTLATYQHITAPSEYTTSSVWKHPLGWFQTQWSLIVQILHTHPRLQKGPKRPKAS